MVKASKTNEIITFLPNCNGNVGFRRLSITIDYKTQWIIDIFTHSAPRSPQTHYNITIWGVPGSLARIWLLLAPPGSSWLLLVAPGSFWLLLAAPGSSWLLLAAPGSFWQLLAPLCSSSWQILLAATLSLSRLSPCGSSCELRSILPSGSSCLLLGSVVFSFSHLCPFASFAKP